jgi:hypothetical protein
MTHASADLFDHSRFLANTTQQPGIYQMFGGDGEILYVGKAKNLKARLASYFRKTGLTPKTQALVSRIARIEVTVTASETEALIPIVRRTIFYCATINPIPIFLFPAVKIIHGFRFIAARRKSVVIILDPSPMWVQ